MTQAFVIFVRVESNPKLFSVTFRNMKADTPELSWMTNQIHLLVLFSLDVIEGGGTDRSAMRLFSEVILASPGPSTALTPTASFPPPPLP